MSAAEVPPMHERVLGRTDDMIKIKGVNIYPGQVDHVLQITGGRRRVSAYRNQDQGKDNILVSRSRQRPPLEDVAERLRKNIKTCIGILVDTEAVPDGSLPRSEKKRRGYSTTGNAKPIKRQIT